jgi:hypothetical protein
MNAKEEDSVAAAKGDSCCVNFERMQQEQSDGQG